MYSKVDLLFVYIHPLFTGFLHHLGHPRALSRAPYATQTINAREDVERREPSCTVDGNVNCYSHCGEQYEGSLKN